MATSMNVESLTVSRDRADAFFREAMRKARKGVKPAPGGVRSWIFHQLEHGAYNPQRAIYEFIDLLASVPGSSEENVAGIGQCFVDYAHQRFAERAAREAKCPTVRDILQLSVTTDADELKAAARAIAEPESLSALESVIETTEKDTAINENVLAVCRGKLADLRLAAR